MTAAFARQPAGMALILAPALLLTGFASLTLTFDYPSVLRFSTAELLTRFQAGGAPLIAQWYLMVLASVLFIPAGLLLHPLLIRLNAALAPLATGLIVIGGLVNALGFLRWPFLVPQLAAASSDPASSQATRDAISVVFQAFHRYAGAGVGEHLGFLFLGGWLLVTGRLLNRGRIIGPVLGALWIIAGLGTLVGVLESLGLTFAEPVNAVSSALGMVAVLLTGLSLLRRPLPSPQLAMTQETSRV